MATGDPRLKRVDIAALANSERELAVSAVVAFEFVDLQKRGRLAVNESFEFLQQSMAFRLLDLPAQCWLHAAQLPQIHRDPIDRMLIAHAREAGFTIATADANIRRYPVSVI